MNLNVQYTKRPALAAVCVLLVLLVTEINLTQWSTAAHCTSNF